MVDRKKWIIAGVVALIVIVAVSLGRYAFVVAPAEQARQEDSAQQANEANETEEADQGLNDAVSSSEDNQSQHPTLDSNLAVSDSMRAALADMNRNRWESPEAGYTLTFSEGKMTISDDGAEPQEVDFKILDAMELLDDSTANSHGNVAIVTVDDDQMLMWVQTIPKSSVKPDLDITPLSPNPYAPDYTETIRFSGFSGKSFYPVEEKPFSVVMSDAGKKLLDDHQQAAEEAISAYAKSLYPSATIARFKDVATLDFKSGIYALFFELNDQSKSTITAIYKEGDPNVQVKKGEVTEYDAHVDQEMR